MRSTCMVNSVSKLTTVTMAESGVLFVLLTLLNSTALPQQSVTWILISPCWLFTLYCSEAWAASEAEMESVAHA